MVSGGESWDGLVYKARDYISTRYNINSFSIFIIQGGPPPPGKCKFYYCIPAIDAKEKKAEEGG